MLKAINMALWGKLVLSKALSKNTCVDSLSKIPLHQTFKTLHHPEPANSLALLNTLGAIHCKFPQQAMHYISLCTILPET